MDPAPTKPAVSTENKAVIDMTSLPLNTETDVSVTEKWHKCNIIRNRRLWHILTQFSISVFGEYGGSSV